MCYLNIKDIGIGTWSLAGDYWGEQSHSDSLKTIHSAIREGFKTFDTAPVYGKGRSEQLLGQQFKNSRENFKISTKCFLKPLEQFSKSINNSLKRLNTDYIDNFFIHWPSTEIDSRPYIEVLEKYRNRGIIKKIGLSNFNKPELIKASEAGNIDIIQNAFNFFWTNDREYFIYCKKNRIETQAYSVLAQGLLTGKFSELTPFDNRDLRSKMSLFDECNVKIIYKYLDKLKDIAQLEKTSPTQLAIYWTLKNAFIDKVIIGCRTRKQVEELTKVTYIKISDESLEKIDKLSLEASNKITGGNNIFNHFY